MSPALIKLVGGQTVSQTTMSGLRAALSIYALKQGHSVTEVGLIIAGFSASNLLLSVPIGRWVDRRGLQQPWQLSVLLGALSAGLCALWPSLVGMCLAAMLVGTSTALSQLAAQHHVLVSSTTSQARAESIGWIMMAPAAAAFFGPMWMGVLLDRAGQTPADQQALWAVCASVAILAAVSYGIVRSVPDPVSLSARRARAPVSSGGSLPDASGRWTLMANPQFRRVLMVNTLSFTCWNAFLLIIPVLGHERGLSATMVGAIFGAFSLTAAVSRPLLPRLMRQVPRRTLLVTMYLACSVLFAAYVWMDAAWAYVLGGACLGLTLGSVQVLLTTQLADESPTDKQGEAMGLRMMTYSATSVVMPIALGLAGAWVGQAAVLLVTAAIAALGAGMSTRLDRSRRGGAD